MLRYLKILAIADIHSPRYLHLLVASISKIERQHIDIILIAGDAVDRGHVEAFRSVLDVLNKVKKRNDIPIVSVFGNEEYFDKEKEFYERYPDIIWLNDSYYTLEIDSIPICIVGSRGILQRPTVWQSKHIPGIQQIYRERIKKLKELLRICKKHGLTVLLTHYATSYATVYGEPQHIYSYLGYPFIESLSIEERPIVAIHGHAHNSKRLKAVVNGVEVYNVALPARRDVTMIDLAIERPMESREAIAHKHYSLLDFIKR